MEQLDFLLISTTHAASSLSQLCGTNTTAATLTKTQNP